MPFDFAPFRWAASAILATLAVTMAASGQQPPLHPGAAIFQQRCASCHGADGQGSSDGLDQPLAGDLSLDELARLIENTMPEDDPEACVGEEARQVADYIYSEFYSPGARHKKGLAAPRVELLRLTVPQYRNAVADLLLRFTPASGSSGPGATSDQSQPGLNAEYYQSKGMNKTNALSQQRVDLKIDFDFGEGSPAEGIAAEQFAIVWEGGLIAPDTGDYEFRIRTPNGARFYLNTDPLAKRAKLRDDSSVAGQSALIDAWVSSGTMRDATARVFLLGGRCYPLRLEFFKYKEQVSSIKLEWKAPHGVWSVIDGRHFVTLRPRRTFVVDVSFPPDDRSLGYERGRSVSQEWHLAVTRAAVATAAEVVARLPLLAGMDSDDDENERRQKAEGFLVRFAGVAFRRPLTPEEERLLSEVIFQGAANVDAAVRRAVIFVLESPYFLYADLTGFEHAPTHYAVASRLALALWDSIPDRELWEAAAEGRLATPDQIRSQAERMLASPLAQYKMRRFFTHWLEMDERDLAKDKQLFPEFDEHAIAELRSSLQQFTQQVVWSRESDYRELLLADYLLLNDRLRALYDVRRAASEAPTDDTLSNDPHPTEEVAGGSPEAPAAEPGLACLTNSPTRDEFERVTYPAGQRAGVLTHPYLLSALAYHNNTSPIHRGVFVTRKIVGRALRPPPMAVAFRDDEFAPDLTMREKITQLTRDKACMSCHSVVNPIGFALENFDSIGRWRTTDGGKPIDSKTEYVTATGQTMEFRNAVDIARFAVASESAHRAFVRHLFQHLVTQDPAAYGPDTLERLRMGFVQDNFNIQKLMVRIATLTSAHSVGKPVGNQPASGPTGVTSSAFPPREVSAREVKVNP